MLRKLALVGLVGLVCFVGAASATAKSQPAGTSQSLPFVTNWHHGDLTITIAGPLVADSLAQCTSGHFCFWGSTGWSGTFYQWSADGWHDLRGFAGPFKSLYNHRSRTAYVHQSSQGPPEFCTDPGLTISSMNSAYWHAAWLYMASSQTACG
jgi:hypothetical protein